MAGHYLAANPALARIYGYDSPKLLVTDMTDIGRQLYVAPGRRDEFIRLMREHGTVSGFESQVYRRDGTVIWISECCREVRTGDGRLLFYEGTVEEITPRKRAEEELRAAKEEAEEASKAKSAFLNTMSHELRTPLNAVLGFAEMLRDELLGPLGNPQYRDYARDIHKSGRRLLDIINDILDLTKIEAGRLSLNEQEVDIGNVLERCERRIADFAIEKGIQIEVEPPPSPTALQADPARLDQILLNLVSNAVKFSPGGNRVSVSAGREEDGAFFLRVADSGIGMNEDEVAKALKPFQQVDASLARRFEGIGLGLTLTKSLVELHGGTLAIVSAPGRGTTVTANLPAWRVAAAAKPAPQSPKSSPMAV